MALFNDYALLSLPDLSTLRCPPADRQHLDLELISQCSEKTLLVALARCLGAYCASADVLLAWQPQSGNTSSSSVIATRVTWHSHSSWNDVLNGISLIECRDTSHQGIASSLGIDLDPGQTPFLAAVSQDESYDSPIVLSILQPSTLRTTYSSQFLHSSTATQLADQIRNLTQYISSNPLSSPKDLSFLPKSLQSYVSLDNSVVSRKECAYTHIPEVQFVTEFLPRHDPSLLALEFYPDLYTNESDSEAILNSVQHITYGELHTRSNSFAVYLVSRGLQLEDRVALCMHRGPEFFIAMLGILKAGGCYVPIDAELPEERRTFIAQDSNAKFVYTLPTLRSALRESSSYPSKDVNNARPEGLAYLLYTSGTTGTPKGCLLTHDGLSQAIMALSSFNVRAGEGKRQWKSARYLAIASIAFDVHLSETFTTLALGGTVISAPRSQLLEDLPRWIKLFQITHLGLVPSLIEATLNAMEDEARHEIESESNGVDGGNMSLAFIAAGGEKISDSILSKWADHPLVTLANFYGPSEVTIGCSARLMSNNTRKESVGPIFKNCSSYVLDENLDLVIRGGVGELVVGGRLVGRGYHGRPDLTEKAFITFNGERVYRTGDLVRLMPDDTIEILGRIDTQIKLRGVRIESEGVSSVVRNATTAYLSSGRGSDNINKEKIKVDVSTILARHPQVQADQLVSFVALDSSVPISHRRSVQPTVLPPDRVPRGLMQAITRACSRELASYMRPAHIVPLNFLPLNPNGKTDGKALGAVFCKESLEALGRAATGAKEGGADSGSEKKEEDHRPFAEEDMKIVRLVAQYTNVKCEELKRSSNLFQLGFDSLRFVKLAGELRKVSTFGNATVGVSELIRNPTLGEIVSLMRVSSNDDTHDQISGNNQTGESKGKVYVRNFAEKWRKEVEAVYENYSSIDSLEHEDRQAKEGDEKKSLKVVERVLPTFPVQDGVLYRSSDLTTLYVQHVVLELQESTNLEKLKSAWKEVVRKCEILRTVFHFSSEVVQVVLDANADSCALPFETCSLTESDDTASDAIAMDHFSHEFINGDALVSARSINENISSRPAFRLALYQGIRRYLTLSIHHAIYDGISLPLLLKDVEAHYHNKPSEDRSLGAPLEKALVEVYDVDINKAAQFWYKTFDGFDWSKVPQRLANGEECAQTVSIPFSQDLRKWEAKASERKVSLQAILTAAFGVCLGEKMYESQDVVFGVIRSGRSFSVEEVNDVRAPLLTVLPARVKTNESADVLRSVQDNIGGVLAYESVSLGRVQAWLQPGRPLFEVLFSISIDDQDEDTSMWKMKESVQPQADYILAVEVVIDKKEGKLRIDGAFTNQLTQDFVISLLEAIECTAEALVDGTHTVSKSLYQHRNTDEALEGDMASDEEEVDEVNLAGPVDPKLEKKLREVVSSFLKVEKEQVNGTASLIALGLDSIKSVGLARMLRADGMKVSALEIMKRPSVRGVASAILSSSGGTIESEKKEAGENAETDGERTEKLLLAERRKGIEKYIDISTLRLSSEDQVEVYPTTVLQAGMLSQTISSGGHLYIHAFPFTLVPDIDFKRLKEAWESAINYFSTLRTSFHFVDELGSWIQIVHSMAKMNWSEEEVELAEGESLTENAERYIAQLDYSSEMKFLEPPVFLRLYRRRPTSDVLGQDKPSSFTLVLVLHHALYDGISISRLQEIVEMFYKGEIPEPEPQFTDLLGYFDHQERYGTEFWSRHLKGLDRSVLPQLIREGSSTSGSTVGGDGESLAAAVPPASISATCAIALDSRRMGEASRLFDVTIQCFGQAVLSKVLARLYNRRDIIFGHVVSGRNVKDAENVLGPVISTIPCRTKIGKKTKNIDLVRGIHKQNTAAHNWQHASLRSIQRKLGLSSLWDAIFVFQPLIEEDKHELWAFDDSENEIAKVQYPLNIEIHQKEDRLVIMAACQSTYFTAQSADNLVKEFRDEFLKIVENLSEATLPYLPVDDEKVGGNSTQTTESQKLNSSSDQTLLESDTRLSTFMDIIAESTKVPREHVHLNTSLVSLGVDSISAIQISARARAKGLRLRAADVLYCDVPVDVLKFLKASEEKKVKIEEEGLTKEQAQKEAEGLQVDNGLKAELLRRLGAEEEDIEGIYPASAGMKWLIGMWQLSGRSRFQHVFVFELLENMEKEKMVEVWNKLVQRHPILRSTFASTSATDLHVITFKFGSKTRPLSTKSISSEDEETYKIVTDIAKDMVEHPLSTETPPVYPIFVECNGKGFLIVHLHHFQYDAWSMGLLLEDFTKLHRNEELTSQHHLTQFLHTCETLSREEQRQYWEAYLTASFTPSLIPKLSVAEVKRQRKKSLSLSGLKRRLSSSISNMLSIRQSKSYSIPFASSPGRNYKRLVYFEENAILGLPDLRKKAQDSSVSLNAIFLACWARVQAQYSKSNSATFGLWHLGRSGVMDGVDSLAVPSMNVLPVHVDSVDGTLKELASKVQVTLRQRSAVVEQSHLDDVNRWIGRDNDQTLLNVFVNIVGKTDLSDGLDRNNEFIQPVNVPYFIPEVQDHEIKPTAERIALCNIIEEAALVDIVERGQSIGMSIEYSDEYLNVDKCKNLVASWAQAVLETLDQKE